jgi:predicted Zn-dependent protease
MLHQRDFCLRRSFRLRWCSGICLRISAGLLFASAVWPQAVAIYKELLETFPNNPELLTDLSIAQFKARHYKDAIKEANAALELRPELATANLFLGASYVELGEFSAAAPFLKKVLETQPNDRNAILLLAQAFLGAQQFQDAAGQFQRASELIPDNPKVWYGLGQSYERLSKQGLARDSQYRKLAQQAYSRLMQLPPSRESCIHTAELRAESGEWVEAAEKWREALNIAPGDARARTGLAWALYRARDYSAALALIDSLRKDGLDSAELKFLTGACWLNLEQPEKSIFYFNEALQAEANLLSAQAGLGQALLRMGKAEEAIPHLKAALSTDEDGSRHFQLFRAYQAAGQREAANHALAEYKEFARQLGLSNP